jgi:light-regulated signal transduction histidine kinase (bacteriophytochrome)
MDSGEQNQLRQELLETKRAEKDSIKEKEEVEKRYKYDVRILNVLATIGLKASSISHEMNNDRNAFSESVKNIIAALKEYGLWETLCSPERTQKQYMNVPSLLNVNQRVGKKVLSFMDIMLTEIEKQQFEPGIYNIHTHVDAIKKKWEKDYAWISIKNEVDDVDFYIAEDILQVIFDNLILNSIQQNGGMNHLDIKISMKKSGDMLEFHYQDMGKGLDKKYHKSPRAILEVHETSRKKGHGLGMWIVNNTVVLSGGEVGEITCPPGFSIYFTIGGNISGKV